MIPRRRHDIYYYYYYYYFIAFMQGIYSFIPETRHVSGEYTRHFEAILYLYFLVHRLLLLLLLLLLLQ